MELPQEDNNTNNNANNAGAAGATTAAAAAVATETSGANTSNRPTNTTGLSVASLRRVAASPLNSPTRTLRLTETEHSSRERARQGNVLSVLESLRLTSSRERNNAQQEGQRPNSNNSRGRGRGYESPLNPNEFRRTGDNNNDATAAAGAANNNNNAGSRRITIRPLAGASVGTTVSTTRRVRRDVTTVVIPERTKSRKQGPSHRKIRRWNNDHFGGLANEIAKMTNNSNANNSNSNSNAIGNGPRKINKAAEVLYLAHQDAHLYRPIYDPTDTESELMNRFMTDDKLKNLRDRFFEGELPSPGLLQHHHHHHHTRHNSDNDDLTLQDCMDRIDPRLRRVVVRACTNSYPAQKVVERFETFILRIYYQGSTAGEVEGIAAEKEWVKVEKEEEVHDENNWWKDLLLEPPTVVHAPKASNDIQTVPTTTTFYFDPDSSTGGFHRLLLHAVCQFHGLPNVVSKMMEVNCSDDTTIQAKALCVTGRKLCCTEASTGTSDKHRPHHHQFRIMDAVRTN